MGVLLFCPWIMGQDNDTLVNALEKAYSRNNPEMIFELAEKEYDKDSLPAEVMFYLGWAHGKRYRFAQSISLLEKALQRDSTDYRVVQLLGNAYLKTGQSKKAYDLYLSVYNPESSPLWLSNQLAELSYELKMYTRASDIYKTLLQEDSLNYYYHKELGNTLFKMRQNKQAAEAYKQALYLNPNDLSLYNKLGNLYLRMKEYSTALDFARQGLERDTTNGQFLSLLGYACFKMEKYDSSLQYFSEAIDKGDTTKFNYKFAGLANFDQKNFDRAVFFLEKARVRDTLDAQVLFYLGSAQTRNGQPEVGVDRLFEALRIIYPDKNSLLDMYSEIGSGYLAMDRPKSALHYYREAYKVKAEPELSFQMAHIYDQKLDEKELALSYYKGYLTMIPENDSLNTSGLQGNVLVISRADFAKKRIREIKEQLFFEGREDSSK